MFIRITLSFEEYIISFTFILGERLWEEFLRIKSISDHLLCLHRYFILLCEMSGACSFFFTGEGG